MYLHSFHTQTLTFATRSLVLCSCTRQPHQGLSEVLAALGPDRLAELMPTFIENTRSKKAAVREGHLMLFMFLPISFGDSFSVHVADVVEPIVRGLSDVEEPVRDAALKTGRNIISHYLGQSITLLLPNLMDSCLNDDWHIRLAALTLCGDLLYQRAGKGRSIALACVCV